MTLQLRPYQRAAIDGLWSWMSEGGDDGLVVLPTGAGKSLIIAELCREVLDAEPDARIIILTHVRELIVQDYAELIALWPSAPAGIWSAGLKRRDRHAQILFAGIQSVHAKAYDIQRANLVLIDEAHLLPRSSDTMYRRFLADIMKINPACRIVGLTATPYRLDSGYLHKGPDALFSGIAYEVSVAELIKDGYLCPLISIRTKTALDTSGVKTRGGEFIAGDLERAVDVAEITRAAVQEIIREGQGRNAWLVFASGVHHGQHITEELRACGIATGEVYGSTPSEERTRTFDDFKAGKLRALVNINIAATGFNHPAIDLIAMIRPTQSVGLYYQQAGRGLRKHPSKTECVILDFAGNVGRLGPIDDLRVKDKNASTGDGEAPVKVCPECEVYLPIGVPTCPHCGHIFPAPAPKITAVASGAPILTSHIKPEWLKVDKVYYSRHKKPGSPDSMKVGYQCGFSLHFDWICLGHEGFARKKAVDWWRNRGPGLPVPDSVDEALEMAPKLRTPSEISVKPEGRFTRIVAHRL